MNKSDLMVALSKDSGLSVTKATEVVNMFFGEMTDALVSGDRVEIRGLGSFKVKRYDGYTGRNPKTGKLVKVKPKKLPFFKCGKELKERVDTTNKAKRRELMKQLKKDLQAVSKTLRQLTRKTEKIAKRLDKLEKTKPTMKAKPRAARKPKPKARAKVTKRSATASPSGAVLAIIKRSRKGVDVPTLKNKTALEGRRVNDIIYRLKKEGKIKSSGRGIYVKT